MTEFGNSRAAPVAAVHILLPVWGYKYIKQMLEFCIPTLIASGNIPSVAKGIKTKFVLLTRTRDAVLVNDHPSWVALNRVCDVEISSIDDLITRDNHTAVITLAFHRAIVEAGEARKNICFVLMNSDFLVANNALKNIVDKVQGGASAILAGNFQVAAEEATPILRNYVDLQTRTMELSPRQLLSVAFLHLHPATIANIVNLGVSHNSSPNRLFWRVNADTLIGRFFLIHVVAIRPERVDEMPGSSYDYSFIPEMCPSGNVHLVDDSDEYVVVEMQPKFHEASQIRLGPLTPASMANSLAEWATAQHRANSSKTIYFHSKDIPPAGEVHRAADQFISETMQGLFAPPLPHENHPYWIGSIAAHEERTGRAMTKQYWMSFLSQQPKTLAQSFENIAMRVFGMPSHVSVFHPSWRAFSVINSQLRDRQDDEVLFVSQDPVVFSRWLSTQDGISSFQTETLTSLTRKQYLPMVRKFDLALLILNDGTFRLGRAAIARIASLLTPGGKLFVLVNGANGIAGLSSILDIRLKIVSARYQTESIFHAVLRTVLPRAITRLRNPFILLLGIMPAAICIAIANLFFTRSVKVPGRARVTSVTLEMARPAGGVDIDLPDDLDGPVKHHNPGVDAAAALMASVNRQQGRAINFIEADEEISRCVIERGGA